MRRRRDQGAVAVEAALITPIVVLLVFGAIDFGLVMRDWLGVTSAARGGARVASSLPRTATFADTAADRVSSELTAIDPASVKEMWVYRAKSNGYPEGDSGNDFGACTACVKYTWNSSTRRFVASGTATWTGAQQNACVGTQDTLGVYVRVDSRTASKLFAEQWRIKERAVMRLEPMPSGQGLQCRP